MAFSIPDIDKKSRCLCSVWLEWGQSSHFHQQCLFSAELWETQVVTQSNLLYFLDCLHHWLSLPDRLTFNSGVKLCPEEGNNDEKLSKCHGREPGKQLEWGRERERNCLPCSLGDCALAGVQFTCARLPNAAASERWLAELCSYQTLLGASDFFAPPYPIGLALKAAGGINLIGCKVMLSFFCAYSVTLECCCLGELLLGRSSLWDDV